MYGAKKKKKERKKKEYKYRHIQKKKEREREKNYVLYELWPCAEKKPKTSHHSSLSRSSAGLRRRLKLFLGKGVWGGSSGTTAA